jgi:hypothetical protein
MPNVKRSIDRDRSAILMVTLIGLSCGRLELPGQAQVAGPEVIDGRRGFREWAVQGSNLRPPACKVCSGPGLGRSS